jgi:hypothetical protein
MLSKYIPYKLLYIGAWDHIDPVFHFSKTKEFVFIDTQPRSEFDNPKLFETCFYRHNFYKRITDIWSLYGFTLLSTTILDKEYYKNLKLNTEYDDKYNDNTIYEHINPTLLHFVNPITDQTIKYYISTNIKYNMCKLLEDDIKETDGLILSGYFPNKIILDYLPETNKTFYCYSATCYSYDPDDKYENIAKSLYENYKSEIDFVIIDTDTGKKLHKCDTIKEVDQYLENYKSSKL